MSKDYVVFNKIIKDRIFKEGFDHLVNNNRIDLSTSIPVVIYGPNGTGKTSFTKLLGGSLQPGDEIEFEYNDQTYIDGTGIFYTVSDSNGRHIASYGEEYVIGNDIRREQQLSCEIDGKLDSFKNELKDYLKNEYGIKTKDSEFIRTCFKDVSHIIADKITNQRPRDDFDEDDCFELIEWVESQIIKTPECDKERKLFIGENYAKKDSLVSIILKMYGIDKSENIAYYHQDNDATDILMKYPGDTCIVCDNNFQHDDTLERKKKRIDDALEEIDESSRKILEMLKDTKRSDVFNIEKLVVEALTTASIVPIQTLQNIIKECIEDCKTLICNKIRELLGKHNLKDLITEYKELKSKDLTIDSEDEWLLCSMIESYINRRIRFEREGRRIKIYLGDDELSTVPYESKLSTGEENFISLCFELIRAKNTSSDIIIVDDPISSFDSVFKSKVVFMMLKILSGRNVIVLTHNMDTIKLIKSQKRYPQLYIMNNSQGGNNGFIKVSNNEIPLVTSVSDFVRWIKKDENEDEGKDDMRNAILDKKSYLISMIPFVRSYTYLLKSDHYESLCDIMHYRKKAVDLGGIYHDLFGYDLGVLKLNSDDILNFKFSENILCKEYPLLNRALNHNIKYHRLRIMTERVLIDCFKPKISGDYKLGEIMDECLKGDDYRVFRVALMSKKVLINEFNHFESDLNVFQPSLDISDEILEKETTEVMKVLEEISNLTSSSDESLKKV